MKLTNTVEINFRDGEDSPWEYSMNYRTKVSDEAIADILIILEKDSERRDKND